MNTTCEPPFWKNPDILYSNFTLEYKPQCEHSRWNYLLRMASISIFIAFIALCIEGPLAFGAIVIFGLIIAIIIISTTPVPIVKKPQKKPDPVPYVAPIAEHFVNGGSKPTSVQPYTPPIGLAQVDAFPYSGPSLPDHTPPTSRNPFMNILLDEIKYNPTRPEAAPVSHHAVAQTFDDYFRVQWYSDPTDVFGKNQNQRQYITQPSTTVPNDQGSFANWLYRIPGKTCKEGGRSACVAGTDGSPIIWYNQH
jgi:hypothetical protein